MEESNLGLRSNQTSLDRKFPIYISQTTGWRFVLFPTTLPQKNKKRYIRTKPPCQLDSVGMYGCPRLDLWFKKKSKSNGNEIIHHTVDGRNLAKQLIWRIYHFHRVP